MMSVAALICAAPVGPSTLKQVVNSQTLTLQNPIGTDLIDFGFSGSGSSLTAFANDAFFAEFVMPAFDDTLGTLTQAYAVLRAQSDPSGDLINGTDGDLAYS